MNQIRFWTRKLYRRAVQEITSRFYLNPEADPRKSILIAGAAHSGTTWLEDEINGVQIENILRVVEAFGLGWLYDDSLHPVDKNVA